MGFFNWFKNLFLVKTEYEEEIVQGIDVDHIHDDLDVALDVVKRIRKIAKDNEAYKPEFNHLVEQITTLEKVSRLPKAILDDLEQMAHSYAESMLKKESFKKVVNSEHPEIVYLEQYKEDIEKVIGDLKRIEENQRIVKRDLDILEGEKADIYYKKRRFKGALIWLKYLLIGVMISTVIAGIVFTALISSGEAVLIPALITFGIVIALGLYIFIFRRYLVYEIKKAGKLDKRAIALMNKTKLKYVNNQQYLDFAYQKYRVNSCEMLELRYENLQKLKRNKERYKRLNTNIGTLLEDIAYMLKKYNIEHTDYVTDQLDYFSSKDSRDLLLRGLKDRKDEYQKLIKKNEKEINFMFDILKDVDPDISMEKIMAYRI